MTRLIDADALGMYEALKSYYGDAWRDAQAVIDEAPTVDAVPVRYGHWVGIDDEPCEVWECDVCGYIYETDGKLHRYCPHCGAKMGEENGTD